MPTPVTSNQGWDRRLSGYWAASDPWRRIQEEAAQVLGRGPVRTLDDMTPEEISALERRYGCPVRRKVAP